MRRTTEPAHRLWIEKCYQSLQAPQHRGEHHHDRYKKGVAQTVHRQQDGLETETRFCGQPSLGLFLQEIVYGPHILISRELTSRFICHLGFSPRWRGKGSWNRRPRARELYRKDRRQAKWRARGSFYFYFLFSLTLFTTTPTAYKLHSQSIWCIAYSFSTILRWVSHMWVHAHTKVIEQ